MAPPRTRRLRPQGFRGHVRRELRIFARPGKGCRWGEGCVRFLPSPGPDRLRVEAGFTLMEILVAVAVLAICLVTIMQLFSGGLRSSRIAADYNRAVFHAREKMEQILAVENLGEGVEEGDFGDGFRWWAETVLVIPEVEEAVADDTMPAIDLPFDILYVRVVVFWGAGDRERQFELETAKPIEPVLPADEG